LLCEQGDDILPNLPLLSVQFEDKQVCQQRSAYKK
jgi:hypothetical protein